MAPIDSRLLVIQVLKFIICVLSSALQLHFVLLTQVMMHQHSLNQEFLDAIEEKNRALYRYRQLRSVLHSGIVRHSCFHESEWKLAPNCHYPSQNAILTCYENFISPRNEKSFCSHENFRSTWKLRPTWESEMKFRSTWVSFRLHHVSAPRALTVDRNEFQTDLKLRPVWVCSCEGTLSSIIKVELK